jgi:signal transduction histidine kinase
MFRTAEARQAASLTLGVWLLSGVLYTATSVTIGRPMTADLAATVVVINSMGVALSLLLYLAATLTRRRRAATRFGMVALAATVSAMLLAYTDVLIMDLIRPPGELQPSLTPWMRTVANFVAFLWILGMLGALYMTLQANWTVRERERQLADARAAASEANAAASAARLAALRYQLNPHFLFNTLNAVSAAVITNRNEEAETMLSKLADFLRVTLVADPQALIPLEDELATLQAYLEIESVRFRERLALEFVCPPDLNSALVPSFLLQPLVENAIKHAVSPTSATVTLRLEATRDGDDMVVIVQDDGQPTGEKAPPGAGVGLRNVRLRLEALYGERGVLQATPLARGFLAMVRMPIQWNAPHAKAAA